VNQTFTDLCDILGDRQAALCRELTKRFEETRVGTLTEIAAGLRSDPPRGEIVILVDRGETRASDADVDAALRTALATLRVRDAADAVSRMLGLPRAEVYRAALRLSAGDGAGTNE
jgi:16S rRNA (cytidine1402-2'-O)-methyltransferase